MKYSFIQQAFSGPVDIVGDIHGEIAALEQLLQVLGYDRQGRHPEQRKLIFVGDLCDRGQDSVAVMKRVKQLIDDGYAQCVIGNHELNLLTDTLREGNGWFFGSPHLDDCQPFDSIQASVQDRQWILQFLNSLPVALESEQLRVVHACWHQESIDQLRRSGFSSLGEAYADFVQQTLRDLHALGINESIQREQQRYQHQLKDPAATVPLLQHLAEKELREQMQNPVRVITSGAQKIALEPIYAGGRWRMIDRVPWWDSYSEQIPVITGHYWRNFKSLAEKTGLFKTIDALQWYGQQQNVFCVDYSVGKRYIDRQQGVAFRHRLGALRLPEHILSFEDDTHYSVPRF